MKYAGEMKRIFKWNIIACIIGTVLLSLAGIQLMLAEDNFFYIVFAFLCLMWLFKKMTYGFSKEERRAFNNAYVSKEEFDWQSLCLMYSFAPVVKSISVIMILLTTIASGIYKFHDYCMSLCELNQIGFISMIHLLIFEILVFKLFMSIWMAVKQYDVFRKAVLNILN